MKRALLLTNPLETEEEKIPSKIYEFQVEYQTFSRISFKGPKTSVFFLQNMVLFPTLLIKEGLPYKKLSKSWHFQNWFGLPPPLSPILAHWWI